MFQQMEENRRRRAEEQENLRTAAEREEKRLEEERARMQQQYEEEQRKLKEAQVKFLPLRRSSVSVLLSSHSFFFNFLQSNPKKQKHVQQVEMQHTEEVKSTEEQNKIVPQSIKEREEKTSQFTYQVL